MKTSQTFCAPVLLMAGCACLLMAPQISKAARPAKSHRRASAEKSSGSNPATDRESQHTPVVIDRELMITNLGVVEDPIFTNPHLGPLGLWTFKYIVEQMSGENDPSDFVMSLFVQGEDYVVNGYPVISRPLVREQIIDPWLARSGGGKLDLAQAPVKLLAIVNRMDLRSVSGEQVTSAGEGRFIFGVLDETGQPLAPLAGPGIGGMTIIFEFGLPAGSEQELMEWAEAWHRLGQFEPGTFAYNLLLAKLTKRFTDRGRGGKTRPNQSALNQIRTNEIALGAPWELREFVIDASSGLLRPNGVAQTPDFLAVNNSQQLADLLNGNAQSIRNQTFVLPNELEGGSAPTGPFPDLRPSLPPEIYDADLIAAQVDVDAGILNVEFLSALESFFLSEPETVIPLGSSATSSVPWQAPGVNGDVRHLFAVNTCSGCHRDETGTFFLHVGFPEASSGRNVLTEGLGDSAALSPFLTGATGVSDPVDPNLTHDFNDLARRQIDLETLLRGGPSHRHRMNRVH